MICRAKPGPKAVILRKLVYPVAVPYIIDKQFGGNADGELERHYHSVGAATRPAIREDSNSQPRSIAILHGDYGRCTA